MLLEWAFDQYIAVRLHQPRYRRRVGGGVFTLLLLLGITGVIFSGVRNGGRSNLFDGLNLNQDNLDEFLGDKHESDQTLSRPFLPGNGFSVDNPRGDVTVSGTSDDNQIHVAVHKEVYTRSDSDADTKPSSLALSIKVDTVAKTSSSPCRRIDGARADLDHYRARGGRPHRHSQPRRRAYQRHQSAGSVTANHGDVELSAITGPITRPH